jgi:hypothetical protein
VLESGKEKDWKRVGCVQPTAAQSGCTGLSGAPVWVLANRPLSGIRRWRTTIIHRPVRWCNGRQRNGRPCNPRATRGPRQRSAGGTGLSGVHRTVFGAPTSPKIQWLAAPGMEGDLHRTINSGCPVRCATRQKARIAFQECFQRLLAALGL